MANIIRQGRKGLGQLLDHVNDFTAIEEVTTITTSNLNKLWRAKILLDRKIRPKKVGSTSATLSLEDKNRKYNTRVAPEYASDRDFIVEKTRSTVQNNNVRTTSIDQRITFTTQREDLNPNEWAHDEVSAEDRSNKSEKHQALSIERMKEARRIRIYNIKASPVQWIELQTIPEKVTFQGESTWAVINSMGRNTPMYHFTGAETVIQFNVSWYCNDPANPVEVVAKCRLLEAWSKANGYAVAPPVLEIQWGDSDLFRDQKFILTAATYELKNWKDSAKVWDATQKKYVMPAGYVDPKLNPMVATQELIFRRVSASNLTYENIIPRATLKKTKGVTIK